MKTLSHLSKLHIVKCIMFQLVPATNEYQTDLIRTIEQTELKLVLKNNSKPLSKLSTTFESDFLFKQCGSCSEVNKHGHCPNVIWR